MRAYPDFKKLKSIKSWIFVCCWARDDLIGQISHVIWTRENHWTYNITNNTDHWRTEVSRATYDRQEPVVRTEWLRHGTAGASLSGSSEPDVGRGTLTPIISFPFIQPSNSITRKFISLTKLKNISGNKTIFFSKKQTALKGTYNIFQTKSIQTFAVHKYTHKNVPTKKKYQKFHTHILSIKLSAVNCVALFIKCIIPNQSS